MAFANVHNDPISVESTVEYDGDSLKLEIEIDAATGLDNLSWQDWGLVVKRELQKAYDLAWKATEERRAP